MKNQQLTKLERELLSEKIKNLFKEQGYSENDKIKDEFGKERNLENEINEYIDAFGEEIGEDIEKIDSQINEFFFNYEILKNVNEQNLNLSENIIKSEEEILKDIELKEKELNELKDKLYNKIEEKDFTKEEKLKYKEIVDKIIEQISNVFKFIKEKLEIQMNILKDRFLSKNTENIEHKENENIESYGENSITLSENDKIKIADMKELPKSILNYLAESENPRVLRKLALNESLDNEIFLKLAKCNDLKTKELLLENLKIPSEALEILVKDKDSYISQNAIINKNLSSNVLKNLYYENKNDSRIVRCIARNENTPREILADISYNSKEEIVRNAALKNKNHPLKNEFVKPEKSDEQNELLYKNLLLNGSLRKIEILKMFRDDEIYADKDGNAIFTIKDKEDKIVGAYQIDFNKDEKPILLENSYANQEDLEKVEKRLNTVYESLVNEETIEETEDLEIE